MALVVLDASVLIAFLNRRDALHERSRNALSAVEAEDLCVPASALSETLVFPARRNRLAETIAAINALIVDIVPLDQGIAERAAVLRGSHRSLRLPDALVIATALELNAEIVLTADRRWGRIDSRVRVV